jgi:hypothetical protein
LLEHETLDGPDAYEAAGVTPAPALAEPPATVPA